MGTIISWPAGWQTKALQINKINLSISVQFPIRRFAEIVFRSLAQPCSFTHLLCDYTIRDCPRTHHRSSVLGWAFIQGAQAPTVYATVGPLAATEEGGASGRPDQRDDSRLDHYMAN